MTVTPGGLGWSPKSTPYKQFALDSALGHLLGSSVSVARQRQVPCIVCDMTAGPGCDPHHNDGSPVILARHLDILRMRGHDVRLICVERKADYLAHLRALMGERFPDLTVDYFTAQAVALATVPRSAVGLTYWDPTRYNDLDRDLLTRFGRSHYYMDILVTRECLAGYRMMRAAHCPGTLAMQDYLALTGKKRNYIMEYTQYHWWALGFADNWETRPTSKMRSFVDVRSDEGQRLCRKWIEGAKLRVCTLPEEQSLW